MATGRVQSSHVNYHGEVSGGRMSVAESLQDSNVFFSRKGITRKADSHTAYVQFVPVGRERPNLEKIRRWQSSPSLKTSPRDRTSPVGLSPRQGKGLKRWSPSMSDMEKDPNFFCQGLPLKRPDVNTKGESPRPCSSLDSKGVVRLRISDCTRFWSHHLTELVPTVRASHRCGQEWRQEDVEVTPRYRLSKQALREHDCRLNKGGRRWGKLKDTSHAQNGSRHERKENDLATRFVDKGIDEDVRVALVQKKTSEKTQDISKASSDTEEYTETGIDALHNGMAKSKLDRESKLHGTKSDEDFSSFNAAKVALVAKMHDLQDFISKTTEDGTKDVTTSPRRGLQKRSTKSHYAPLRSLLNKQSSDFIMGHVGCHGDCGQCFQAALMPDGAED